MHNIKGFVYKQLKNNTDLYNYIWDRIYPSQAPLWTVKPLIVYNRVWWNIDIKWIRIEVIQVSIWGDKITELEDIMHIIIPIFNNLKTPPIKSADIKQITETFDKDTKSYGIHIDIRIKLIEQ